MDLMRFNAMDGEGLMQKNPDPQTALSS